VWLAAADRYREQVGSQRSGETVNLVRYVTSQVDYRPRIGRAGIDANSAHAASSHCCIVVTAFLRVTGCGPASSGHAPHDHARSA
jgi:hypothetical protein